MIIGLSGSFGSGKTTRSQYLAQRLSKKGIPNYFTNFAGNLKKMLISHLNESKIYINRRQGIDM